jgi:hypothetical protein
MMCSIQSQQSNRFELDIDILTKDKKLKTFEWNQMR